MREAETEGAFWTLWQEFMMKLFAKTFNNYKPLTIFPQDLYL